MRRRGNYIAHIAWPSFSNLTNTGQHDLGRSDSERWHGESRSELQQPLVSHSNQQ
jgi:hypothetical protein